MVVEADESDGTFVKLPATVVIVTNIDPEHLDFYGDFDTERSAFQTFVENIPFYGFAALCIDHPEVQALCDRISDRKIITYGLSPLADVRAERIVFSDFGSTFDVVITDRARDEQRRIKGVRLNMPGAHNVQNALSAFVIANEMGIADDVARGALQDFGGVKRRFTITGSGGGVTVVDDYAHHPVEIAAVLKAARDMGRERVLTVVQPHRYSRLRDLFEEFCTCFNNADTVIVADVYPAGEAPLDGFDRDALIEGLRRHGHRHVVALASETDLADVVAAHARAGDLVICMGAGNITAWAQRLPEELAARIPEPGLREVGA